MQLDPNVRDFIGWLLAHRVRFLAVGGYAVGVPGHPRSPADLDIGVAVDEGNAQALLGARRDVGFGDLGLNVQDFLSPEIVVQLGDPPLPIDPLSSIDGVAFSEANRRRLEVDAMRATSAVSRVRPGGIPTRPTARPVPSRWKNRVWEDRGGCRWRNSRS